MFHNDYSTIQRLPLLITADLNSPAKVAATSGSADSVNSQLYGAISTTEESGSAGIGGIESDDQEMYSEEDVLAGDIITTDEVNSNNSSTASLYNFC